MIINECNDEMKLWNGLPAILIEDNGEKNWAFFTKIDNDIVVGRFPENDFYSKEQYEKAKENGAFNCYRNRQISENNTMKVVLCLTEKCNCRCRYCFLDAENVGISMSTQVLHKAIDKAIEIAGNRHLIITAFGGEPGIEGELLKEMVTYACKQVAASPVKSCNFSISTNGIIGDNVIDILLENKFKINISMDGTQEVQDFQRPLANGEATYHFAENTIKKLAKEDINDIKIRCTVTQFSVDKMPSIVENMARLAVRQVHFEPVTPGGRGANGDPRLQPPSVQDFVKYLKESIEIGEKLNVDVLASSYMKLQDAPAAFCDGNINNKLIVSPEGNLSTCVEVQSKSHELFDCFSVGYYDTQLNEFVFKNKNRRECGNVCSQTIREACSKCPLNFYCAGWCPTRNYRGSGHTEVVDKYYCAIVKEMLPYVLKKIYKTTYC